MCAVNVQSKQAMAGQFSFYIILLHIVYNVINVIVSSKCGYLVTNRVFDNLKKFRSVVTRVHTKQIGYCAIPLHVKMVNYPLL